MAARKAKQAAAAAGVPLRPRSSRSRSLDPRTRPRLAAWAPWRRRRRQLPWRKSSRRTSPCASSSPPGKSPAAAVVVSEAAETGVARGPTRWPSTVPTLPRRRRRGIARAPRCWGRRSPFSRLATAPTSWRSGRGRQRWTARRTRKIPARMDGLRRTKARRTRHSPPASGPWRRATGKGRLRARWSLTWGRTTTGTSMAATTRPGREVYPPRCGASTRRKSSSKLATAGAAWWRSGARRSWPRADPMAETAATVAPYTSRLTSLSTRLWASARRCTTARRTGATAGARRCRAPTPSIVRCWCPQGPSCATTRGAYSRRCLPTDTAR
mmetsp:Transcript_28061/g.44971  ORF Transcript_28061/g.44971 Transcript_28061/m.44971 type:complete len:326 (-) Transcript_28061:1214-2191(-)